jgi:class 3 adenylate cyclase
MTATLAQRLTKLASNRTYVSIFALVLMAGVAAIASVVAVQNFPLLTDADRLVQDWQIAHLLPFEPQDKDVVVVAVNEDTLQQFQYRSPVDRGFLANLLTAIASKHPRAIGVDFLFDQPTEQKKDDALKHVLVTLPVPLAVSFTHKATIEQAKQTTYLDAFVPPKLRALPDLATDQFGTVRWNYPGARDATGRFVPSFSHALASDVGVKSDPVQIPMAWRGPTNQKLNGEAIPPFAEYPANSVATLAALHAVPTDWFTHKIVLIGSDVSLEDRHRTPFSVMSDRETMAGVVVQANAVAQILDRKPSPFAPAAVNFLIALICAAIGGGLGMLNHPLLPRIATALGAIVLLWTAGAALFHYGTPMIALVAPTLALLISFSAMDSLTGREARKQRQFIQGAFSRYVSPKVVEALVRDPAQLTLEGERREMTFVFTDLANFTTFSEDIDSRELARMLNAYFDGVTKIVLRHEGMVDKFIGDSVFAIFNAPVDIADHAEKAVKCGLEIDAWSEAQRAEQAAKGQPFGITRIGIHTGTAVVGNFGSSARFNYTAQGDAVNTASRLEGLNKKFGTRICVSGATKELCKSIAFRPIGSVVLKGKTGAIEVWQPLHDGEKAEGFLERYRMAYIKLEQDSPEAQSLFDALHDEAPDDPCVALHAQRLRHGDRGTAMAMTEK